MIPPIEGKTADEIITEPYRDEPGWHVHTALRWLNYVDRDGAVIVLHYAAFHLRHAVEHLWLWIFSAACGGSFSVRQYQEAINDTTKLYKLLNKHAPEYEKFARFDELIQEVDPLLHPRAIIWDNAKLRRIHGGCGEKLLHLQEAGETGYRSPVWVRDRTEFLRASASWMWNLMNKGGGNILVNYPNGLNPEPRLVWDDFRTGKIDEESAKIRLKLIHPLISRGRLWTPDSTSSE